MFSTYNKRPKKHDLRFPRTVPTSSSASTDGRSVADDAGFHLVLEHQVHDFQRALVVRPEGTIHTRESKQKKLPWAVGDLNDTYEGVFCST